MSNRQSRCGEPDDDAPGEEERLAGPGLSRAAFLKGAAGALGLSAAGPLLGAAAARAASAPKPVRGGTLAVAYPGGGTSETLNPILGVTPIDESRIQALYDPLVLVNPDLSTRPGLALDWTPNKDATAWEVKLRPGVTFHNGKTFGSDDVIFSIHQMAKKTSAALPFVSNIRLGELKAVNKTTLQIPLASPDASLLENFVYYNTWIMQNGETNFSHPVGTGPFKFKSFTPGQQSVFAKNANYWQSGKPYVDTLKILSVTDPTARLNALLSGQIDAMALLPYAQAKAHQSIGDIDVLVAKAPQALVFYMETTKPPFSDVRVRQAIKLIANRPQLVADAISGFGTVGNDIAGKGLKYYDNSLPQRVQDIPQAKSLLKAAGHEKLTVTMEISNLIPGFIESATLFQQQAIAAGVTVKLQTVDASAYFNPSLTYLKMLFAESQWPVQSLKFFYQQALASNAPYNETHWSSASWNKLLNQAIGELNEAKAQSLWNQVQEIQYNQGGYMVWTNADYVDALSTKVKGLVPSSAGILGNHSFLDAWKT
jgi:peptide/nickel transport system substrate-binding protein